MRPVKIITDSTCDLPLDMLKDLGIEMIPLSVIIGGKIYHDQVEISPERLFDLAAQLKELPKTSAIPPADFYNVFQKWLDKDYDIVFCGLDSKISSTYNSACSVARDFPDRIFVVDSLNLCSAIGLMLLKMVKFRDMGLSAQEIYEKTQELTPKVQCSFAIDVMDYLYKGGRCSGMAYFAGKLLHIHPVIRMESGVLIVHRTPRGKMYKALDTMIDEFKKDYEDGKVDDGYIVIAHASAMEYRNYVYKEFSKFVDPKRLLLTNAGCVICAHCGPGTIGIMYMHK